ncbi:MAG TPA: SDR family oxidoreductase [Vicinamibacterales bacterium]|nr:SDR family oxidoreductase [Vicinamibacterales bacterium]
MTQVQGVALVTGGGAGLGRACAITLGQRGARVAVHYMKSREGAEETVATLHAAGVEAHAFEGNLTRAADVRSLVDNVTKRFGSIDILVNNAGDLIERKPLIEMSEALFHAVMDVNLTSTFLMCQAAGAGMIVRKTGTIVNMSSLAAWNGGGPGAGAYSAAKGAVVSLTKALAKELAPHGIRVNCVAPGLIGDTAFHGRFTPPAAFENAAKGVLLGRAGTPAEVATVVAFLASPDASFLTGETIEINGGMNMR